MAGSILVGQDKINDIILIVKGVMSLGWCQENSKIYYLQNNLTDNWYGNVVTGIQTIDGQVYRFDNEGLLKQ